jgi:hypothetical protein
VFGSNEHGEMGKRNRAAAVVYCERRERKAHWLLVGWPVVESNGAWRGYWGSGLRVALG